MTATGILLILIGLFVIVNSTNFVGVLQGNKAINSATKDEPTTNDNTDGSAGGGF